MGLIPRSLLRIVGGNAPSLPWCGTGVWKRRSVSLQNWFRGVFVQRDGFVPRSLLRIVGGQRSGVAMVWNRRCHGVEPACGNDGAFPCRNGFEAYLCSVMGLIPQSLLRIVGGQRSVVAMVWNRRVETTERFPAEMVSRAYLCSVKWHAFSEACTKKVGRKMRPTCVKVLFRWT